MTPWMMMSVSPAEIEIGLYKFASVVPDALGGTFDFESVDLA